MQRTDGGKPKKAARDDENDDAPRVPFDARAEAPAMPSDGSFQSSGQPLLPCMWFTFVAKKRRTLLGIITEASQPPSRS